MSNYLFRPYHYGSKKWEDYLIDVQQSVEAGNTLQRRSIKTQEQAITAARGLIESHDRQTERLTSLEESLKGGLEALCSEVNWGFTLLADRMDRQIEVLSQVAASIDAVHQTLRTPLMTQARELYDLGQDRFQKALLDKALEAFLQSAEKNEVYFPLQLQIGKLYLYGKDEDDDVINLVSAEKHLLLAARYAESEKGNLPAWGRHCGEALFHAGVSAYLLGGVEFENGQTDSMRICLERSLKHLDRSKSLWPEFSETLYTQAKCHARLGNIDELRELFVHLADWDRRYFSKSEQDGDFAPFRGVIEEVLTSAISNPGKNARALKASIEETRRLLIEVRVALRASGRGAQVDTTWVDTSEATLNRGESELGGRDIDIESWFAVVPDTGEVAKIRTLGALRSAIKAADFERFQAMAEKDQIAGRIRYITEKEAGVEGNPWVGCASGCLSSVVLLTIAPFLYKSLGPPAVLITIGLGFVAGYFISRSLRNEPNRREMAALSAQWKQWENNKAPQVAGADADIPRLEALVAAIEERCANPLLPFNSAWRL